MIYINEKLKNLEKKNNDKIKKANEKINNLEKKIDELISTIDNLKKNSNIPIMQINTLKLKIDASKKNNNVCEDNYEDYEAGRIKQKMNQGIKLYDFEQIYFTIFKQCHDELKRQNFSLLQFKNNHTTDNVFKNVFHRVLKKMEKAQVQKFFENIFSSLYNCLLFIN